MKKQDLTGRRFGRREVVSNERVKRLGCKSPKVLCRCDCGRLDYVEPGHLLAGKSGMCMACARGAHNPRRTHGQSVTRSPEYSSWVRMNQRCNDPNSNRYHIYKDVEICERWSGDDGFLNFLKDMGPKPGKHYSIDRIDNERGYEPENCRWATPKQQARNRKNSSKLTHDGVTKTISEWAEELGVKYYTLRRRVLLGWSPKEVIQGHRDKPLPRGKQLEIGGVSKTVTEWAEEAGVKRATFYARITTLGWTPEEALRGSKA